MTCLPRHLVSVALLLVLPALPPAAARVWAQSYVTQWGTYGSESGQFQSMTGVVVGAGGNVYVAEDYPNRFQVFSNSGTFLFEWSGEFDAQLMAADAVGNVYVADYDCHIQKFTGSGAYITTWGSEGSGNGQFMHPLGVAVDSDNDVYVADTDNHRIQKFTSAGVYITQWGSHGAGNGQFDMPVGIGVDAAKNVYVSDLMNGRIQKFTSDGAYLTQWGSLLFPAGLAVDAAGLVYVVEYSGNRCRVFTGTGSPVAEWGSPGSGDGQFDSPRSLAVDANGNVYVGDCGNYRIQKFARVADAAVAPRPMSFRLAPPSPNPSSGRTLLDFGLPRTTSAALTIHDVSGRCVARWQWSALSAGPHQVEWDGRTAEGAGVPPGILFCQLSAGGQTASRRLIHLR